MNVRTILLFPLLAFLLFGYRPGAAGGEPTLNVTKKAPPKELADSFRKLLEPRAVQLIEDGKPVLEFWFPSRLSLAESYDKSSGGLDSLGETTVLGAAVVHQERRDYRDDELYTGTYTMRLGLRPSDGNHLGTSTYLYFAVLTPAGLDKSVDSIKTYKQLVDLSSKESATDHPFILSLRPGTSTEGEFPRLNEPAAEHESILLKIPARGPEEASPPPVVMDLVYKGVALL